jgi:hypothetical protein
LQRSVIKNSRKIRFSDNIHIFAQTGSILITPEFTYMKTFRFVSASAITLVLAFSSASAAAHGDKNKSCCSDKAGCEMKSASSAKAQKASGAKVQKVASITRK